MKDYNQEFNRKEFVKDLAVLETGLKIFYRRKFILGFEESWIAESIAYANALHSGIMEIASRIWRRSGNRVGKHFEQFVERELILPKLAEFTLQVLSEENEIRRNVPSSEWPTWARRQIIGEQMQPHGGSQ